MNDDHDEIGDVPQIIELTVLKDKRREWSKCSHRRFEIDRQGGAAYCQDCGVEVPAFEVLCTISMSTSMYHDQYYRLRTEINELKQWKPWLRAMKHLEEVWRGRKMIPQCPHCRRGVEAEALASTGLVSREYDKALAQREEKLKLVKE